MTYRDSLTAAMDMLTEDPLVRFIGYGLLNQRGGGGTIRAANDQITETPVAENLMVGIGIGMALKGLKPVVFVERMDFILNAADAIVNHLNAMSIISRREFNPTMILRAVIGNREKPLFTGHTHTQRFTDAFRSMVNFPVIELFTPGDVEFQYQQAHRKLGDHSTMLVEFKDLM